MKKVKTKKIIKNNLEKRDQDTPVNEGRKLTILTLGDSPNLPTGVGTQSNFIFRALVDSGKFKIRSLGGNMGKYALDNYGGIMNLKEGTDDFLMTPTEIFGTKDEVRSLLRNDKPDILWFMTDPRYYTWLWEMEDEIRPNIPMVYYHVWDNYPYPTYNKNFYDSTDEVVAISKLTKDIVEKVSSTHSDVKYIPHAVDSEVFKPADPAEVEHMRKQIFSHITQKRIFFYNSRNAHRKMTSSLVMWFKEYLDKVGKDEAHLILHTDPVDYHGTDLYKLIEFYGLTKNCTLSTAKQQQDTMNLFYNLADVTVCLSNAEGFGLSSLESMSAGTPVMATTTGGLMDQLYDSDGECYGFPVNTRCKTLVGSPPTPWVYEDRPISEDVVGVFMDIHNKTKGELKEMGLRARNEHVMKNFNFNDFKKQWVDFMLDVHEKHGSWPTKNYNRYEMIDIAGGE